MNKIIETIDKIDQWAENLFFDTKVNHITLYITLVVVFSFSVVALKFLVAVITNGLVLQCLWQWFVVPTFGVKSLSFPAAIGLLAVFRFITVSASRGGEKEEKSFFDLPSYPLWPFAIGFIVSFFM